MSQPEQPRSPEMCRHGRPIYAWMCPECREEASAGTPREEYDPRELDEAFLLGAPDDMISEGIAYEMSLVTPHEELRARIESAISVAESEGYYEVAEEAQSALAEVVRQRDVLAGGLKVIAEGGYGDASIKARATLKGGE